MRHKWHFRNEPTPYFKVTPVFELAETYPSCSKFYKEEWQAVRALKNEMSIVIKKVDKDSCVVVWDRNDYIAEAEKQLSDENIYKDINFKDKILQELPDSSNKLLRNLKKKEIITEKELKYFTIEFKKAANLGKLYLLLKIHQRLENVPGRPVISNCGTPTEKVSEFLDSQLKPVMQSSQSYIKDSGDFIKKIKNIGAIPKDSILVTADVVGLYPSVSHEAGLRALEKAPNSRTNKNVSTEDLVKMAKFVLKNNYFELTVKLNRRFRGQQ